MCVFPRTSSPCSQSLLHNVQKCSNVGMLTPLVKRMLTTDPNGRPSAAEALAHFRDVRRNARTVHRIWRLWSPNEALVIRPIVDMWWMVSSGRGYRSRCALLTPSWPLTTGLSPARPCLGLIITGIRDRTRIGLRFLAICAQCALDICYLLYHKSRQKEHENWASQIALSQAIELHAKLRSDIVHNASSTYSTLTKPEYGIEYRRKSVTDLWEC